MYVIIHVKIPFSREYRSHVIGINEKHETNMNTLIRKVRFILTP